MNTFIAIYKKHAIDIDETLFSDYLIDSPKKTQVWHSKDKKVLFISYIIKEKTKIETIISDENSVFTYEGFPLLIDQSYDQASHIHQLFDASKQKKASIFDRLYGEYSAAFYTDKQLQIGANLGGTHGLYYTKNEHLVAFTNRSPLLLQLPFVSDEVDPQSSAWKSYQGYISTNRTPFIEIKKLPIGSNFSVDEHLNITEKKTTYSDLKKTLFENSFHDNPLQAYQEQFNFVASYMHKFKQHHGSLKFDVPLSGGKDSRLILAFLIKAGLKDNIEKIWTRGPLYSPEVISSKHICEKLKIQEPEIRRLATITTAHTNISSTIVINNLNNLEANLSLYDFQGIGNYNYITMQGHQIALRDGAFTNCRTNTLNNFLNDAYHARMHDPLDILNQDYKDKTHQEFNNIFSHYHINENAPLHDLGDLYYLKDRLLNWASVYCNSQYYSGPMSNPLLLGNLFQFSFSIPYEFRTHEIFHYLGIKYSAPEIVNIPFAEQRWNENISDILAKIGIKDSITPALPYKSHKDFPNVANPYVSTLKIDYFNSLKSVAIDFTKKHQKDLCEYMHTDKFIKKIQKTSEPVFRELYCGLGTYSDLILREYKGDIFNRQTKPDIIKDLENRISRPFSIAVNASEKTKKEDEILALKETYKKSIESHEKSIASLVIELQACKKKSNNTTNILGTYSDLILRKYKGDIFNRQTKPDIIKDLENRISRPLSIAVNASKKTKKEDKILALKETYEKSIESHEKSIASLVIELQACKKKSNNTTNINTPKSNTFTKFLNIILK